MNSAHLIGFFFVNYFVSSLYITIDSDKGNDTEQCLYGSESCRSLRHVANYTNGASNITIEIVSSSLLMQDSAVFSNINGLNIIGQGADITCNGGHFNGTGIFIKNCSEIALSSFSIAKCGGKFGSTYQSIAIKDSFTLSISYVNIMNSTGRGIVISNVQGNVLVSNCNLLYNGQLTKGETIGQGGMSVTLNYTDKSNYSFTNCNFEHNLAYTNSGWKHIYKHGGGLQILIYDSSQNKIILENCNFINNRALIAAGFKLFIAGNSTNNFISVVSGIFKENEASGGGGGADIGFSASRIPQNNTVEMKHCYFFHNKGVFGGGLALFTGVHKLRDLTHSKIIITSCNFTNNTASGGSAVDINKDKINENGCLIITEITFISCQFTSNMAETHTQSNHATASSVTQAGAFFTSEIPATFQGHTTFSYNYGSALYASSAKITFGNNSITRFLHNSGVIGGAILLMTKSSLSFGTNVTFYFTNNTASYGGAICSLNTDTQYYGYTESCFIDIPTNNVTMIFDNNTATTKIGADIFTSSMLQCSITCSIEHKVHIEVKNLFQMCFENIHAQYIATPTFNVTVLEDWITAAPGQLFHMKISQHDYFNNEVGKLFPLSASLINIKGSIKIDPNYVRVTSNISKLYGLPQSNATLVLQSNIIANIRIEVNVVLSHCPPGFYFDNSKYKCNCSAPLGSIPMYEGIYRCTDDDSSVLITDTWAGYVTIGSSIDINMQNQTDENFVTSNCDAYLCSYSSSRRAHYKLPRIASELNYFICGPYREGVLCTECTAGNVTYYHSPSYQCGSIENCRYGIIYYALSELLPVTVLFLIILLFNINMTSGAVYTFILYSQLMSVLYIDAFGAIEVDSSNIFQFLTSFYSILYGIVDLNILNIDSLSFCLHESFSIMDLLIIKYATTLYALFLVTATIVVLKLNSFYTCIKLCHKCGRRNIRGSVINGLTAFLTLSYFQCVNTTYTILIPVVLQGKGLKSMATVPLFAGNMPYMGKDHLKYAIPAVLCFIIVILPLPLILLMEPILVKLSSKIRRRVFVYYVHKLRLKLKPFLDSFQGCFKDNCRCFAGLFFLYRVLLFLPVIYSMSIIKCYVYITVMLLVIFLLHSIVHPFQERWHNFVDLSLLSNLVIVNLLTVVNYYSSLWGSNAPIDTDLILPIQLILLSYPLLYIILYIVYSLYKAYIKGKLVCKKKADCRTEEDSLPYRLVQVSYGAIADVH